MLHIEKTGLYAIKQRWIKCAGRMALQRIRDPLHNLIVFDTKKQLDRILWNVICSPPFQRLRRIKQLGFSELVYPGASHTRFAHSLGVYQTAKELIRVVRERSDGDRMEQREHTAIAAALVHDVGHGPFSHAFEEVGRELGLKLARHEEMSDHLIRKGEIAGILKCYGSGFADDVADMIKKDSQKTVHNAVVSSQFDADRLDYMRRDRLMTGNRHSSVDFAWLVENLEVGEVDVGVDNLHAGKVPTFIIGPKAIHTAEAYVLGLFQLYPTVYYHKTTRGAEKIFTELLIRLVKLVQDAKVRIVELPGNHPLVRFAKKPDDVETVLRLDDTVIWGSLSQLRDSKDPVISSFAGRLLDRKLFKCLDIRTAVHHEINPQNESDPALSEAIDKCCDSVLSGLEDVREKRTAQDGIPAILLDKASRSAYNTENGSQGPIERINVRTDGGSPMDLRQRSEVVANIGDFKVTRAYYDPDDCGTEMEIRNIIGKEVKEWQQNHTSASQP